MRYYVGIDMGTSSVKALFIDEEGRVCGECVRSYTVSEPGPGWKEIEPEFWMDAVTDALEELLRGKDAKQVEAVGVTGQMHTIIVLDKDGKPIRPALMWNDTRTAGLLPDIREQIRNTTGVSYLANVISTGSPAMNLYWLKKCEPENFERIRKFLIGPDYIVYRLTGKCQTDYCEASTSSLFDLNSRKWSPEIRDILGFPEEIYPEVKGSIETAGTIKKEWMDKFGLKKEVKVMVGTGDNPAAAIATGCFQKKYLVLSLGTSGVLMHPGEHTDFDAKGKKILFSFDGKEIHVLVQGVVQSCGNSFSWWMKNILQADTFDEEIRHVDMDKLGTGELLFYPHLTGDKTIYADSHVRGGFLGIGTDCGREDMTIAVMEGICFAVRQLAEEMHLESGVQTGLRVIGGGSKNDVWMQILADVLGVKVIQLKSASDGAGYGIALAAAAEDNPELSMEEIIEKRVTFGREYLPREKQAALYEKKYQKYCKIYEAMNLIYT